MAPPNGSLKRKNSGASVEKGQQLLTKFFSPSKKNVSTVRNGQQLVSKKNFNGSSRPGNNSQNPCSSVSCNDETSPTKSTASTSNKFSVVSLCSTQLDDDDSDIEFIAEVKQTPSGQPPCDSPTTVDGSLTIGDTSKISSQGSVVFMKSVEQDDAYVPENSATPKSKSTKKKTPRKRKWNTPRNSHRKRRSSKKTSPVKTPSRQTRTLFAATGGGQSESDFDEIDPSPGRSSSTPVMRKGIDSSSTFRKALFKEESPPSLKHENSFSITCVQKSPKYVQKAKSSTPCSGHNPSKVEPQPEPVDSSITHPPIVLEGASTPGKRAISIRSVSTINSMVSMVFPLNGDSDDDFDMKQTKRRSSSDPRSPAGLVVQDVRSLADGSDTKHMESGATVIQGSSSGREISSPKLPTTKQGRARKSGPATPDSGVHFDRTRNPSSSILSPGSSRSPIALQSAGRGKSSPAQRSPRSASKSPRSATRGLRKLNPIRYLKSPSQVKRQLYNGEPSSPLASAAGRPPALLTPPPPNLLKADALGFVRPLDDNDLGDLNSGCRSTAENVTSASGLTPASSSRTTEAQSSRTAADLADWSSALSDKHLDPKEAVALSQEFDSELPEADAAAAVTVTPYYLESFREVLESVMGDPLNANLLDDSDVDVVGRFNGMQEQAQMLYMRLFHRKPGWLRAESFHYSEISEPIMGLVRAVCSARLAESQPSDVENALQALQMAELRQLSQQLHLGTNGNRAVLLSRLANHGANQRTIFNAANSGQIVLRHARKLATDCIHLLSEPRRVLMRIISLYATPQYEEEDDVSQRLLTLSLVRLGKMRLPTVCVLKQRSIFNCRDDLLRYEEASRLELQIRGCMEEKGWDAAYELYLVAEQLYCSLIDVASIREHDYSLPPFLRKFTALSILTFVRTQGVELLQRRKDYKRAVEVLRSMLSQQLYLLDYRGRWYDRLALNLHQHLRHPAEAELAITTGLQDSCVRSGHRLALLQRLARLKTADSAAVSLSDALYPGCVLTPDLLPTVHIEARCMTRASSSEKRVFLLNDAGTAGDVTACSVEELALSRYRSVDGYSEGLHREEAPVKMLFTLLFWDALYEAPVPDAFRSRVQAAPLDLNSDWFYRNRLQLVTERLQELGAATGVDERLADVWNRQHGTICLGSWQVFRDLQHAQGLARCMGPKLLQAVCRRLATEFRFSRSGFPDLTLWNPEQGTCRFVEVKGPNDRLSTKQMLWIDFLRQHGGRAEVCHVRAVGARRLLRTTAGAPAASVVAPGSAGDAPSEVESQSQTWPVVAVPGVLSPSNGAAGRKRTLRRRKPAATNTEAADKDDFVAS